MLVDLYVVLSIVLAGAGVLMAFLTWAATESSSLKRYRIRTPETYRIPRRKRIRNITLNSLFSMGLLLFCITFFHQFFIADKPVGGVTVFGEVVATILLYDFLYYFLHRGMHHPKVMKYVHGVHHYARFPTSVESIYLHPAENAAGLLLLLFSMTIIGPVSFASFVIIFTFYTAVNILVHSNLVLPGRAFKLLNFWALKHDLHHGKHLNKNYASITPFWDLLFDTYA